MRHIISIDQERFVQHVDRHGIATTPHPRSATTFIGQDLLKAVTLTIHHEPEAIITLIPRREILQE